MPASTPSSTRIRTPEILFAIALVVLAIYRFGPELRTRAPISADAPDVQFITLSGDTLRMEELRGTVVLVNFWATWCAPCRVEMPAFQRVWDDYRDDGFLVVGLYTDQGPIADLVAWYRDAGVTYPFARATPPAVRGFGHGGTLPNSFLVDREGRIVKRVDGLYPEEVLRSDLEELLRP